MKLGARHIIAFLFMGIFSFFGCFKQSSQRAPPVQPSEASHPAVLKPIDLAHWRETVCLTGRAATLDDMKAGTAVFAAPGSGSRPIDLKLPRCAIYTDQQTGKKTPVIVVQAEDVGGKKTIGYRLLNGADGVCLLFELELLDGPDDRFK
ncbi:MAG: hypothetical protein WCB27_10320 [Thermoguttaceae bacterium]